MPIASSLRPVVLQAREELREQRERLRVQHNEGSPGVQVAARLTELVDGVVIRLFDAALLEAGLGQGVKDIALIAHGGYGRRDLAPFSDVDLMLTTTGAASRAIAPLARRLAQDIVDAGLQLGFAVRTPVQACQLAWQDATVFSSLAESRLLVGSSDLFTRLMGQLRAGAVRRRAKLIRAVADARLAERAKWGEAGYSLRPNIKRGRGALRDIQLIRWIGFAQYGESDPDQLMRLGALSEVDHRNLRRAQTFLLRLRNELHFLSGKNNDILDRPTQMLIAERWKYPGDAGLLPVERFMREYFNLTSEVRYASANFLDSVNMRTGLGAAAERLLAKTVGSGFKLGMSHIWATSERLPQVATDLTQVLELLELSTRFRRRIDHTTWQAIRQSMLEKPLSPLTSEMAGRFMRIMGQGRGLPEILWRLHELTVLAQFVPAMTHASCLLQFNEYHKYTVDAHSIRAVQAATELVDDPSIFGQIYRKLENPALLHLTLLLHDLGKGFEEDHSELGVKIARETGTRLGLPEDDIQLMEILILKHLRMADVAFRHDLNSAQIIHSFAREVGSVRVLQWLLVHSLADLAAVGPDVLTDWKRQLLEELYQRTLAFFQQGVLPGHADAELDELRQQVRQRMPSPMSSLAERCLAELPAPLLRDRRVEDVMEDLQRLEPIATGKDRAVAWGQYNADADSITYTFVLKQEGKPIGTFARASGALSSRGLEILRAEINTIADSIAWDRFTVTDTEFQGQPPPQRLQSVSQAIREALIAQEAPRFNFRKKWAKQSEKSVAILPTRVEFDNVTADGYSVLSLFAYDRPGLLYDIAQTLADAEVVLHFAKIATHFDQAADFFYVTELDGTKLLKPRRQQELREALLQAISAS